jgi:hypothetical protein
MMEPQPSSVVSNEPKPRRHRGERVSFYVWTALVLAISVTVVVLS